MSVIKSFPDGSCLEYDRGSFDEWCVYLTRPGRPRTAPRDTDYFRALVVLGRKYGAKKIYADYVAVYNMTGRQVDRKVLYGISRLSSGYGTDAVTVDIIFSILYMAMIAETLKKYTRLGKRIKRLGIHKLLIERSGVYEAANFMRGMRWRDIDKLCLERGF